VVDVTLNFAVVARYFYFYPLDAEHTFRALATFRESFDQDVLNHQSHAQR
jgi:hypothetical protein